jgi:serine/threonine-protein kinase
LVATGELQSEDSVAFAGAEPRHIVDIPELARHLLPSTTQTTKQLFKLGTPDLRVLLSETKMMSVLATLRQDRQTGAVFVERSDRTGTPQRKELYLRGGRLLHVASSDKTELLGEYLVRRGALTRGQLDMALASLSTFGGRLGDTVIGLGYVDAVDVFRAIRDQGRDRVAALCGWKRGTVSFYKQTDPGHVEFPLDLDLASPMMAGAIVESQGEPRSLLPDDDEEVEPGPRHYRAFDPSELGTAPRSLRMIPKLLAARPSVRALLEQLTRAGDERRIGEKEAAAALVAANALGWAHY